MRARRLLSNRHMLRKFCTSAQEEMDLNMSFYNPKMLGDNVLFGINLQYYLITRAIAENDKETLMRYCAPEIFERIDKWLDTHYHSISLHKRQNIIVDIKRITRFYDIWGSESIRPSEFGNLEPEGWIDLKDPLNLLTVKEDLPNEQK